MYSIGVDIGGTNIAAGIVSEDLKLLHKKSVPFPGAQDPEASVPAMTAVVQELLGLEGAAEKDISAIGLAVPGSVDYETKSVLDAYNLGYHNFPLAERMGAFFPNTPIHVENDANAAALAEYYCGAFKGHGSGLLLTLGTGLGGGLILDHKLFIGGMKNGFEYGHFTMQFGGEPCTCGNAGCVESYCAATALIREGRRAASAHPNCMIAEKCGGDGKKIDAKLVVDCARAGDPVAKAIFKDYTAHLGAAVTAGIVLFDPEVVALGGGVANAGEFLLAPVREYVASHIFFARKYAKVVCAEMGNDAGILGAAMLYKQR